MNRTGISLLLMLVASPGLAAQVGVEKSPKLRLKGYEFDLQQASPEIPDSLAWKRPLGSAKDYFLVQLDHKATPEDRDALVGRGAELLQPVPDNAYLVRAKLSDLEGLGEVAGVRGVVPFQPAYKLAMDLRQESGSEPLDLVVVLHDGVDAVAATSAIAGLGASVETWDPTGRSRLQVRASGEQLADLAQIPGIQWIQREPVMTMRNDTTAGIIQSNNPTLTTLWDNGLFGEGQIIGHIDGPIDIDNCYFDDPAFPIGPLHRKLVLHKGSSFFADDHGTHTAGTAAGDQEPVNASTFRNGIAYKAKIAHTNNSEVSGTDLDFELQVQYDTGARVFTNSWGNDGTTAYDNWARDIDLFSWNNEDALAVWAATNLSSLRNPENSKNCLAVGGSFQSPSQDSFCTGGIGPTSDSRRKPEVFTPGCGIQSADGNTACGTRSLSGTSMATPAVAGACALTREYFEKGYYPSGAAVPGDAFTPTGALVKAAVINATQDMTGVSGYPSNQEGWGRVNMRRSLFFTGDTRKSFFADVRQADGFTAPGQNHGYTFEVFDNLPLEITLAFHDFPGALFTGSAPVNDLDLTVTGPGGVVYRGNVFSGAGESTSGGSADAINNVERVRLNAPPNGTYVVTVNASTIAQSGQGYGLAVGGEIVQCVPYVEYGTGVAGTGGLVPHLFGFGDNRVDVGTTGFELEDAVGGSLGFLLIGAGRTSIPYKGGELVVSPPWTIVLIPLGGTPGVAGDGGFSTSTTFDSSVLGAVIQMQVVVGDSAAIQGRAISNGLEFCFGG